MRALALLLLLLLLPACALRAQGTIHRCMGADGGLVFTDRDCADMNAKALPPAPAASTIAPADAPRAPAAVTCAADLDQLRQAVIDAFAQRNPNRLAGLTLWNGDDKQEVVAGIRYFSRLMAHPLIGVKGAGDASSDDAGDAGELSMSASPRPAPPDGQALIVQTEADDGSGGVQQTRFDVVRRSGCVWLRPRS